MATYVLVHGAWAGAHGFHLVRPLLQAAGHQVFTPSLTGIGERVHLTGPQVGLATHIDDLVNHVLYEDHRDIVLLGFSYGGMVVTGALHHIADRVRHLVYLDALVPADGQSALDVLGAPPAAPRTAVTGEETWTVAPAPREFEDPAEGAFAAPRRVAQPIRTFTEPVRLRRPLEEHPFGRTYIRATGDPGAPGSEAFEAAAAHARSSTAWSYHEIDSNHMIPSNRPRELAEILLALSS